MTHSSGRRTVAQFFEVWSEGAVGNAVAPGWRNTRNSLIRLHILPVCADVPLGELRAEHLWAAQRQCQTDGLAPVSANQAVHKALRAMLSAAVAVGAADDEHIRKLYRSVRRLRAAPSTKRHPCTREQRDAILDAIRRGRRPWGHAFVAWGFATGMRLGESLGLTWADVDTVRRWARVVRTRDGAYIGAPKTRESAREIALAHAAVAALATVRRRRPTDWVFVGPKGGAIDRSNFEAKIWRPAVAGVGMHGWPLYCVRHAFISWQLESEELGIAGVAAYCGTSVQKITETYGRYTRRFASVDLDKAFKTEPVRPVTRLRKA